MDKTAALVSHNNQETVVNINGEFITLKHQPEDVIVSDEDKVVIRIDGINIPFSTPSGWEKQQRILEQALHAPIVDDDDE